MHLDTCHWSVNGEPCLCGARPATPLSERREKAELHATRLVLQQGVPPREARAKAREIFGADAI